MKYFGGVEGGATHSRLVICDEDGNMVATTAGLGTNHWVIGIPEAAKRIGHMVEAAKKDANIPDTLKLRSLGLSLSGCEEGETNRALEAELKKNFPYIADTYVISSDTLGAVHTASPIGGMVVISGTGSNALLLNPDGTTHNCGGWGNYLGDEGSAWYISYRAMKIVFDDMDNFRKSPHSINRVWDLIKEHFNVKKRRDLLTHCYAKFDKPFFASLCKRLAQAANEGDELCQYLFAEAGQYIARSIHALLPNVHDDLVDSGVLNVVCVGSVWLSWHLLKDSFIKEINKERLAFDLRLVTLTKSGAFGACYLGADAIGFPLTRNYSDNIKVMYDYEAKLPHVAHDHNGISTTNGN